MPPADGVRGSLRLNEIVALARSASRERRGVLFIEGVANLTRCVDHGVEVGQLVVAKRLLRSVLGQMVVRRLRRTGTPTLTVPPETFRQMSAAEHASGVAAIVTRPRHQLEAPGDRSLWLAVERCRSPGNLGTMLRTAAAVGAEGVLITEPNTHPYRPEVVRASVGLIFALKVVEASAERVAAWTARHGYQVVGADPSGELMSAGKPFASRVVICVGHERNGLSDTQSRLCNQRMRLPMSPGIDSLNAAMAAGLMLYAAAAHASPRPPEGMLP